MVHLKDFSLLSPKIQSNDVLKAIETAIPATAIERAIATSKASIDAKSFFTSAFGSLPVSSNEPIALEIQCGMYSRT